MAVVSCEPAERSNPRVPTEAALASIRRLRQLQPDVLLSAWDDPRRGPSGWQRRDDAVAWLHEIGRLVAEIAGSTVPEPMTLCRAAVTRLGLPPAAANELVARSLMASWRGQGS